MASYLIRATAASALLFCVGCGRPQPAYRGQINAQDACSVMQRQMPADALQQTVAKAKAGDVSAQRDVRGYYAACDDVAQATYWEDRLVRAGDADALAARSDDLYQQAYNLKDTDPRKLALLKQSLELEARYRTAAAGRVQHVMVNGQDEEITSSGKPDDRTANMRRILARVEAAQRK